MRVSAVTERDWARGAGQSEEGVSFSVRVSGSARGVASQKVAYRGRPWGVGIATPGKAVCGCRRVTQESGQLSLRRAPRQPALCLAGSSL